VSAISFDNSYANLPEAFFARVAPDVVPSPSLIGLNHTLARELGLDPEWMRSPDGVALLSGNAVPDGAEPIAMAYAGHQFGNWSPQLGDGRAVLIGEVVGLDGVRRDWQLKGAGRTPFSRQGDGKSPIGPVIREYVVSEAMAALGIPTTRALAAVATGEQVHREASLPGGVLTRIAQSHVRVGTFEYFGGRGDSEHVRKLADYVIDRHYPEARQSDNPYTGLFEGVIRRQAELIARWMQVGFIHGVMNTDNMQIVGETIDFGPCAFMEEFDAGTVLSSIDRQGRYAWGNQPSIGQWNLTRLAESLLPLFAKDDDAAVEMAKESLGLFGEVFNSRFIEGFCQKLGVEPTAFATGSSEAGDALRFVNETFSVMTAQKVDFTLFFRHLTRIAAGENEAAFIDLFEDESVAGDWLGQWRSVALTGGKLEAERVEEMRSVNPIYIPRNHRVEDVIQAGLNGDFSKFEKLNEILALPYQEKPDATEYEQPANPGEKVHQTFCGT
jgi:uncharacterized protein YdiU (UPF0061 family)